MRIKPLLLSLLFGAGVTAAAATLSSPVEASPESSRAAFEEKATAEKSKDTKKDEKAEKITVWVLDAAGKG